MISEWGIDHGISKGKGIGYSPLREGYGLGRSFAAQHADISAAKHFAPGSPFRASGEGGPISDKDIKHAQQFWSGKSKEGKDWKAKNLDDTGAPKHAGVGFHVGYHRNKYAAGAATAAAGTAGYEAGKVHKRLHALNGTLQQIANYQSTTPESTRSGRSPVTRPLKYRKMRRQR